MKKVVPLTPERHGSLRLHPMPDLARLRYALLGLSEIPVACADFPLCLAKEAETGRFNLIALFSLEEPRNLFWLGNQWHATYLPEGARTAPFLLDRASPLGLAIDEDSPRLGREGHTLFDAAGHPTEVLLEARTRLERVTSDIADAQEMVNRFAELKLIRPLSVVLKRRNGTEHEIDGLYNLGAQALAELDDAQVIKSYRAGHIAAASLIRASLRQLERLRQLHNASSPEAGIELRVQVLER